LQDRFARRLAAAVEGELLEAQEAISKTDRRDLLLTIKAPKYIVSSKTAHPKTQKMEDKRAI